MLNDVDLIEESKKRNKSALEQLYIKYAPKMKGIAYRYVSDMAQAEDILHDAFIKAYEHIHSLNENSSFEGWLRRIVINKSLDFLKKEKKLREIEEEAVRLYDEDESETLEQCKNVSPTELLKAITDLPTGYKTVLNMYMVDGFSHKEIAEKLGITEGTSKSQLAKAKDYLKKQLTKKSETYV